MNIKTPEEIADAILALLPRTKIVVDVGGEADEVDLEEFLPQFIENTLTARDAALEKTLREKVNDIRAAFEGTTPSDTDRAYLAALIDFDAIITATLSGDKTKA